MKRRLRDGNSLITIPSNILFALDEIEKAGYEAFLVGGAVRDLMMDVEPHDYDVATSATPEQVMEVFSTYTVIPPASSMAL